MWASTTNSPSQVGRPQSDFIAESENAFDDFKSSQFKRVGGSCEASVRNLPKALNMLALAAEQGLVAILHDVDSLNDVHLVPAQLLLPEHCRQYTHDALDAQHEAGANTSQRRKTMHVQLDLEGFHNLSVDEGFRCVLVSSASKAAPGVLSLKNLNVIAFNLIKSSVETILLHQIVRIENASLREQLDLLGMQRARAALELERVDHELLVFLSVSEGKLLTDPDEMRQLSIIRNRSGKIVEDLSIAQQRLDDEFRNYQQLSIISAAATEVHSVLCQLNEGCQDKSFVFGVPVLQSVLEQSLQNRTKGPDRLAQAMYI